MTSENLTDLMHGYPDPTPSDLKAADFEAVWQAIRGWDISRRPCEGGRIYAGATGSDVMHILSATRSADRVAMRNLERERDQLRAELAESKRLLGTMAKADLEGVRDSERLKHWRKWAESFPCVLETSGTDGAMMNAIAVLLHDAETRAESAENNHGQCIAQDRLDAATKRIAELEAQLREAQNAGADEWTADGEAVPEQAALPLKSYPVSLDLTPDCAPIAESPFPAAVAVAHAWGAGTDTTPLSEPEELAERKYGAGCGPDYDGETLTEILGNQSDWSHVTYQLAVHLRETLATIDAVRAFSEEMSTFCSHHWANRLREVLNGKR